MLLLQSMPNSKGNYFNRRDLECLALLLCKGSVNDKVEQLYETLYGDALGGSGQTAPLSRRNSMVKSMSGS